MVEEIGQFLLPSQRMDVRAVALAQVCGLTGTGEGVAALRQCPALLEVLVGLLADDAPVIKTDACLALINLSADTRTVSVLLDLKVSVVKHLYKLLHNKESQQADKSTQILSNLTRDLASCSKVYTQLVESGIGVDTLVNILCQEKYNAHGQEMNFLGPVLSNLSQLPDVRRHILEPGRCVIQRLVAFTEYAASVVKRGGVVGTVRNCCFDVEHHDWLISDKVDIVPRLVLPLAGPSSDAITDEEMESLPVDLQYLDEDKMIEADVDIRIMLLESLTQLCATKSSRNELRNKNIYVILRELHKVEKDRSCLLALENLVDILIKREDEINVENYKNLEVPENLLPKFKEMDETFLKD